jgi:hypothetical protein
MGAADCAGGEGASGVDAKNPPVFPGEFYQDVPGFDGKMVRLMKGAGITLQEAVALAALQGILSSSESLPPDDDAASDAWDYAEAWLYERNVRLGLIPETRREA